MRNSGLATLLIAVCFSASHARSDEPHFEADDSESEALIGLRVESMHPSLTAQLPDQIGKGRGILVTSVGTDSPAAKSGLLVHDILVMYDDQKLFTPRQFAKLVRNDTPGRKVLVQFVRGGIEKSIHLVLAEWSGDSIPTLRWHSRPSIDPYMIIPRQRKQANWNNFESMTLVREEDDLYRVTIQFTDSTGLQKHKTYKGTRSDIRDSAVDDKELPSSARDHLFRGLNLDDPQSVVSPFEELTPLERGMMNWPVQIDT